MDLWAGIIIGSLLITYINLKHQLYQRGCQGNDIRLILLFCVLVIGSFVANLVLAVIMLAAMVFSLYKYKNDHSYNIIVHGIMNFIWMIFCVAIVAVLLGLFAHLLSFTEGFATYYYFIIYTLFSTILFFLVGYFLNAYSVTRESFFSTKKVNVGKIALVSVSLSVILAVIGFVWYVNMVSDSVEKMRISVSDTNDRVSDIYWPSEAVDSKISREAHEKWRDLSSRRFVVDYPEGFIETVTYTINDKLFRDVSNYIYWVTDIGLTTAELTYFYDIKAINTEWAEIQDNMNGIPFSDNTTYLQAHIGRMSSDVQYIRENLFEQPQSYADYLGYELYSEPFTFEYVQELMIKKTRAYGILSNLPTYSRERLENNLFVYMDLMSSEQDLVDKAIRLKIIEGYYMRKAMEYGFEDGREFNDWACKNPQYYCSLTRLTDDCLEHCYPIPVEPVEPTQPEKINVCTTMDGDTDSDCDRQPDWWELEYGLNHLRDDADEDLDGDGYTNYQEYLKGTDPRVEDKRIYW